MLKNSMNVFNLRVKTVVEDRQLRIHRSIYHSICDVESVLDFIRISLSLKEVLFCISHLQKSSHQWILSLPNELLQGNNFKYWIWLQSRKTYCKFSKKKLKNNYYGVTYYKLYVKINIHKIRFIDSFLLAINIYMKAIDQ